MSIKDKEVVLSLQNITKTFHQGDKRILVLDKANLDVHKNEVVSLVGASGSGKTTILQIAGLLDSCESGTIQIGDKLIKPKSTNDSVKTMIRRHDIGFIYQFHHLLPEFSALENVMLSLLLQGVNKKDAKYEAEEILSKVGLSTRLNHRPGEMSGGEQQRVAIARAVVGKPSIILADEPTGNLDPATSDSVFKVLIDIIEEYGLSGLFVTHDHDLAKRTNRVLTIKNSQLVEI